MNTGQQRAVLSIALLAYEMAVCVCDADGCMTAPERQFLDRLAALLQESFRNLLEPAKQMQARYLPQMQQRAGSLDAGQIMAMVRGA